MNLRVPILILLALNALDSFLTIIWIKTGIAPEGNLFMASLLGMGVLPFLLFKNAMGLFTAAVLFYGSNFRLAKYGLNLAIFAYSFAMVTHLFTGLAAYGLLS
jgi:hypothetical protein